jgi:hypothetical protein
MPFTAIHIQAAHADIHGDAYHVAAVMCAVSPTHCRHQASSRCGSPSTPQPTLLHRQDECDSLQYKHKHNMLKYTAAPTTWLSCAVSPTHSRHEASSRCGSPSTPLPTLLHRQDQCHSLQYKYKHNLLKYTATPITSLLSCGVSHTHRRYPASSRCGSPSMPLPTLLHRRHQWHSLQYKYKQPMLKYMATPTTELLSSVLSVLLTADIKRHQGAVLLQCHRQQCCTVRTNGIPCNTNTNTTC